MTKKQVKRRGPNDPALSGFRALQHVIAQTEGPTKKKPRKRQK